MAPNYFAYEFIDAAIQTSDGELTPAIVTTDLLYANAVSVGVQVVGSEGIGVGVVTVTGVHVPAVAERRVTTRANNHGF